MPRAKRTNKQLPQIGHRATGRAKRGIAQPVAQLASQRRISSRLPEGVTILDFKPQPNAAAHIDVCEIIANVV